MPSESHPATAREVVITGIGVVSPIGIGREAFRSSLQNSKGGVRPITLFDASGFPVQIGAEVRDFDPKAYVRPRKSLKVMAREIQFGFAAGDMALADAGLDSSQTEPDRFGVVYGAEMIYCDLSELEAAYRASMVEGKFQQTRWASAAMSEIFPLWMLKNLPNMVACHVAIAYDARGPNNTIGHSDVGSLAAICEAARVIQRDKADVMIAGGVGGRIQPTVMSYRGDVDLSHRNDDPEHASRPFDAGRDGLVNGEGAAAFVLESRQYAERRGAKILGRVLSHASAHEPLDANQATKLEPLSGSAIRQSLTDALQRADLEPRDISHINAHGLSTVEDDSYEARAIHAVAGDLPVTAPKGFFGHLGAGCGAMELATSLVGLADGEVPPTLNYETPDPRCPVNVIREPMRSDRRAFIKLSSSRLGPAAAIVIGQ